MLKLEEELRQKQEEFKKAVEKYNQSQQLLNKMKEDIFRMDGAMRTLQDLIIKQNNKEEK